MLDHAMDKQFSIILLDLLLIFIFNNSFDNSVIIVLVM